MVGNPFSNAYEALTPPIIQRGISALTGSSQPAPRPAEGAQPTPRSTGGGGGMDGRLDIGRKAYRYFIDKGLTPEQAAAWAGNFAWESGGRTDAVNPNDNPGEVNAPHSAGIAQWNGDRLQGLVEFARSQGIDVPEGDLSDPQYVRRAVGNIPERVQLDYAWQEAQGPEQRAFRGITSGQDMRTANMGAISYFRPAGWSIENPAGGAAFQNRMRLGQRIRETEEATALPDAFGNMPGAPGFARELAGNLPTPAAGAAGPAQGAGPQPQPQPMVQPGAAGQPARLPTGPQVDPTQVQRTAAPSGTALGFLDTLMGVPAFQDLQRTIANARTQQEREGYANMIRRAGEISDQNPGLQPQQFFSTLLQDPQIATALGATGRNGVQALQTIAQTAGRPAPQAGALSPGQVATTRDSVTGETTITGPVAPTTDQMNTQFELDLYQRDPELFARYMSMKRLRTGSQNVRPQAEVVTGGTQRARELGVQLRDGERAEVKFERDPITGRDRMVDINFPDRPMVDLSGLEDRETVRRLVKDRAEIQERQAAVLAAAQLSARINEQLDNVGETAGGVLGLVARVGQGISAQATEAARLAGVPLDPTAYEDAMQPIIRAGADSAATQSNITALAFMLARAQNPSGRITEADVERALQQIGAGLTGSVAQMRASLTEAMQNAVRSVEGAVEVRRGNFEGTRVNPPQNTVDLLTENGVMWWQQPARGSRRQGRNSLPAPAGSDPRAFAPGEIERMNMQELLEVDPQSLTPEDAERAMRRYQMLKQNPQSGGAIPSPTPLTGGGQNGRPRRPMGPTTP